jgi:hypothetical protein
MDVFRQLAPTNRVTAVSGNPKETTTTNERQEKKQ